MNALRREKFDAYRRRTWNVPRLAFGLFLDELYLERLTPLPEELDRLVALGAQEHHDSIVRLSKEMYVMSPFTSLLVLETEIGDSGTCADVRVTSADRSVVGAGATGIILLFVAALLLYGGLRAVAPRPQAVASALHDPLPAATLRILSFGESQAM